METPLAFPSGEGGPLAVDEEIDLPQNVKIPVGRGIKGDKSTLRTSSVTQINPVLHYRQADFFCFYDD